MDDKDKIRIVVEIDRDLHHELKVKALSQKKSLKEVIVDFIKEYVK